MGIELGKQIYADIGGEFVKPNKYIQGHYLSHVAKLWNFASTVTVNKVFGEKA